MGENWRPSANQRRIMRAVYQRGWYGARDGNDRQSCESLVARGLIAPCSDRPDWYEVADNDDAERALHAAAWGDDG